MKLRIALILMIVMLLMIVPVYAQDSTAEPPTSTEVQPETHPVAGVAEEEPQTVGNGATTLILLVGLIAVGGVIGFTLLVRLNRNQPQT
jgi:hypothetical protein